MKYFQSGCCSRCKKETTPQDDLWINTVWGDRQGYSTKQTAIESVPFRCQCEAPLVHYIKDLKGQQGCSIYLSHEPLLLFCWPHDTLLIVSHFIPSCHGTQGMAFRNEKMGCFQIASDPLAARKTRDKFMARFGISCHLPVRRLHPTSSLGMAGHCRGPGSPVCAGYWKAWVLASPHHPDCCSSVPADTHTDSKIHL